MYESSAVATKLSCPVSGCATRLLKRRRRTRRSYINERTRDAWDRNVCGFFFKTSPFLSFRRPSGQRSCWASIPGLPQRSEAGVSARDQLTTTTDQGSVYRTLEEIGRLVSHSGNPAETLNQPRAPDQAALRAPTSARSICWSRIGPTWCWPPRSACVPRASDASACASPRAWPASSPSSCGRRSSPTPRPIRDSSTSARRARTLIDRFSASRSWIAVCSSGVLVVQTVEPPDVQPGRCADARHGRHAAGANRQRSAHARPVRLRRRISDSTRWRSNLWWSWDNDTTTPVSRARSGAGGASSTTTRSRSCSRSPSRRSRSASQQLAAPQPDQLRLSPPAGVPQVGSTRGATRYAGCPLGARPVAYFSAEFGIHESLPIYSGGLGILAGDHIKSASDLGIPLVGVGLYYDQGYFKQRLDRRRAASTRTISTSTAACCRFSRPRADGEPITVAIAHSHRHDRRARLVSSRSAATRCSCSTRTSTATSPEDRELTARLYGGDDRVRIRQELLLGVGGVRRSAGAWASRPASCT